MPIPYFAIQSGCIHPHPHNIHIHISSSRACSLGFGFKASKASFSSMTRVGTAISFSAFGKPPGLIVNMVPERPGYQTWGFLAPKSCHVRLSARIFIRTWSSGMVNGAMMYDVQLYQYMSACIHGLSQSPEYAGEMQKRYAAWGLKWNVRQLGFCSWTEANPRLKRILVDLPMLHLEAHMYIYIYECERKHNKNAVSTHEIYAHLHIHQVPPGRGHSNMPSGSATCRVPFSWIRVVCVPRASKNSWFPYYIVSSFLGLQ